MVREILLQWALVPVRRRGGRRYYAATPEPLHRRDYAPYAGYRLEPYRDEAWDYAPEEVRYVRLRPEEHNGWRPAAYGAPELAPAEVGPTLPEHLI